MSKILTVFGATGNQGGSVVNVVLNHPKLSSEYKIRGVTRDTSKSAAQALVQKGVEVVQGDINDKGALRRILEGSSAVFAVTNYWEKASKEVEYTQGTHIADIAHEVGVEHLIWSSLPHVTKSKVPSILSKIALTNTGIPVTNGQLKHVEHFDSKAEVEEYIRSKKMPASFFQPGFFMSNLKGSLRPGDDGNYTLTAPWHPDTKVPMLDVVADTGKFVAAALLKGPSTDPKRIMGVSEWNSPNDIAAAMKEINGKDVKFTEVDGDTFMQFLPPATAKELTENFLLIRDYEYFGPGAQTESKASIEVSNLSFAA